jgi:hypothetical protein
MPRILSISRRMWTGCFFKFFEFFLWFLELFELLFELL